MLQVCIVDASGKTWAVAFSDLAAHLLEATPDEMDELLEVNNNNKFNNISININYRKSNFFINILKFKFL
jgi:hypothetical protein